MRPFYLADGPTGPIFANHFAPRVPTRGTFLFVPPFAEELNRSRHVMAALGRSLAEHGFGLLLIDLYGTGDSAGNFGDGTPALWISDLNHARLHIEQNFGPFLGYIGLRSGALLAAAVNNETPAPHMILWAPVSNGEQFLTQFLRIRVAEGLGRNQANKETTKDLRAKLEAGTTIEVGGYDLTAEMANWFISTKITDFSPQSTRTGLFDLQSEALSPGIERLQKQWNVPAKLVTDPQFWSLLEPAPAPNLLAQTLKFIEDNP